MKRTAVIHSLDNTTDTIREVEIIQWKDVNHVIAEYDGQYYTAVDNPFTGLIYVDDLYGHVDNGFRYS